MLLALFTPLSVLLVSARPYLERNCVWCRSWSTLTLSIAGCICSLGCCCRSCGCAGRSWPVCDLAWCCRSCDGARCPWLRRRCRRNVALCWRRTVLHDGRTGKASFAELVCGLVCARTWPAFVGSSLLVAGAADLAGASMDRRTNTSATRTRARVKPTRAKTSRSNRRGGGIL
jgi:hypothetical protein